jgi:hypothetical protein
MDISRLIWRRVGEHEKANAYALAERISSVHVLPDGAV